MKVEIFEYDDLVPKQELVTKPDSSFLTITQLHLMSLHSVNSRRTLTSIFNNIARIFNAPDHLSFDWLSLRPADVSLIVATLTERKKLKPTTVNSYISAIRALFKTGYINGLVEHEQFNKMSQIKGLKSKREKKNREPIQTDVVKLLIEYCEEQGGPAGVRDAAIIAVLAYSGLRRAELTTIKLEDYNREKRTFKVIGKGDKERGAPISLSTIDRVDRWIDRYRGHMPGYLFSRIRRHDSIVVSDSVHMSGNAIYDMLKKRTKELDRSHIRPHGLRRFCGTTLLKSGKDLVLVRDYLGHESISTTQIYIENDTSELHEAASVFD